MVFALYSSTPHYTLMRNAMCDPRRKCVALDSMKMQTNVLNTPWSLTINSSNRLNLNKWWSIPCPWICWINIKLHHTKTIIWSPSFVNYVVYVVYLHQLTTLHHHTDGTVLIIQPNGSHLLVRRSGTRCRTTSELNRTVTASVGT